MSEGRERLFIDFWEGCTQIKPRQFVNVDKWRVNKDALNL